MNTVKCKKSRILLVLLPAILVIILELGAQVNACPRMQCAPIISKCQLLDLCKCDTRTNYTCYKHCSHCLGDLYETCCSCVDICPAGDENDKGPESHVKLLEKTNEELFDLFGQDEDFLERWHFYKYNTSSNYDPPLQCKMLFLSECVEMYKCESSCISMGASGYRWFHAGCCECVGSGCPDFGDKWMRCRKCPTDPDIVSDSFPDPENVRSEN